MKSILLSIVLCVLILLSSTYAQTYTNWSLPEGAKLRAGKGSVGNVRFSPDGNRLIVEGSIGYWIYDAHTGVELDLITVNSRNILGMSPDARMYVERNSDNSVNVRRLADRSVISTLQGEISDIYYVVFGLKKNILVSDIGNVIYVWDINTGSLLRSIVLDAEWIYQVSLSSDETKLVCLNGDSENRLLQMWDVTTGLHINTLTTFAYRIRDLLFSPDGKTFITGNEHSVQLWDVSTGKRTVNFKTPRYNSIAVSPDGNTLATGGVEGLHLWDIATGEHITKLVSIGGDSFQLHLVQMARR